MFSLAIVISLEKPAGSFTQRSARTFLSRSTPPFLRPAMNLLYERSAILTAAFILVIYDGTKSIAANKLFLTSARTLW